METNWRWMVVTAVAPVAWGANYVVTAQLLPADRPLWGAALRALPAGLLLLGWARTLPRGRWWFRAAVLGLLNIGAFFVLVYLASQLLPSSVAASVMAASPLVIGVLGWLVLREALRPRFVGGALVGLLGVLALVGGGRSAVSVTGVLASLSALLLFAVSAVLARRWRDDTPALVLTSWQLVVGGSLLVIVAVAVEGSPPAVTSVAEVGGYAFTTLVATALAFVCWFSGLQHLPAGTVGAIGLLNPVTGVLLGAAVVGETLSTTQWAGVGAVLAGLALATSTTRRRRTTAAGRSSAQKPSASNPLRTA